MSEIKKLNGLNSRQDKMISMILEGHSISSISKKIGMARGTIYNWLKKDCIKSEIDKRRREITTQGNAVILKDLTTYIRNIQALANDPSDKRTALAANQYLINRVYGNPKESLDVVQDMNENSIIIDDLTDRLSKYKNK